MCERECVVSENICINNPKCRIEVCYTTLAGFRTSRLRTSVSGFSRFRRVWVREGGEKLPSLWLGWLRSWRPRTSRRKEEHCFVLELFFEVLFVRSFILQVCFHGPWQWLSSYNLTPWTLRSHGWSSSRARFIAFLCSNGQREKNNKIWFLNTRKTLQNPRWTTYKVYEVLEIVK